MKEATAQSPSSPCFCWDFLLVIELTFLGSELSVNTKNFREGQSMCKCEGWPCRAGGLFTACRLNGCPLPVLSQILGPSLSFPVSPARLSIPSFSSLVTALKLCLENPPGFWPQIRLSTVACKWLLDPETETSHSNLGPALREPRKNCTLREPSPATPTSVF